MGRQEIVQPKKQEEMKNDNKLNKEIKEQWDRCDPEADERHNQIASITIEQFNKIAEHFYRLGRNAL